MEAREVIIYQCKECGIILAEGINDNTGRHPEDINWCSECTPYIRPGDEGYTE